VRWSWRRIGAIVRKELREFRRNRSVLVGVAIFPLIFLLQPLALVFTLPTDSAITVSQRHLLLYMLAIPVLATAMLAAYAVAGERQQGSLEPILTTPIRHEEFLVAKALAALIPSMLISYGVFAIFLVTVALFARPAVVPALLRPSDIAAQVVFTPLLAGFSIWVAIAISTLLSDGRVAQQLSLLANVPPVVVTSLLAFDVIPASLGLGISLGVLLLLADVLGWRLVSPLFDRERLISGPR
jgi:ABC-type transport system involved in multi-copper enzyme maturation permease subunit